MDKKREKEEAVRDEEPSKKQKKIDSELSAELVGAAERGETERVRELLRMEGVDVHHAEGWDWAGRKKSALLAACSGGHLETARVILDNGGETREELEVAFIGAGSEGRLEIVEMLMARGVDPSVRNNAAVRYAAAHGHCNVVEFLLHDSRVDPAALDNYAVVGAAKRDTVPRCRFCLRTQELIPQPTIKWQFASLPVMVVLRR